MHLRGQEKGAFSESCPGVGAEDVVRQLACTLGLGTPDYSNLFSTHLCSSFIGSLLGPEEGA